MKTNKLWLITSGISLLFVPSIYGVTYTWEGGTQSNNVQSAANWSPNVIGGPGSSDTGEFDSDGIVNSPSLLTPGASFTPEGFLFRETGYSFYIGTGTTSPPTLSFGSGTTGINNDGAYTTTFYLNSGNVSFGTDSTAGSTSSSGSTTIYNLTSGSTFTFTGTPTGNGDGLVQINLSSSVNSNTYTQSATTSSNITIDSLNETDDLASNTIALGANANLTLGGSGSSSTIYSVISGDGTALVKNGTGTLTLGGTNTFTGASEISGGAISITASRNLGNQATGDTALTFTANSELNLDASGTYAFGAVPNSPLAINSGITADINTPTSVTAVISTVIENGTGAGTVNKTGSGSLALTATNTYTGGTTITGGTLLVETTADGASGGPLGTNAASVTFPLTSPGILQFGSGFSPITPNRNFILTGDGAFDLNGNSITQGSGSGVISGDGLLNIYSSASGTPTFTMNNTNTYTGGTTLGTGSDTGTASLLLSGGSAGAADATFTVNTGSTFETGLTTAIGDLAGGGTVNIGNGTTLTVGNSTDSSTDSTTFSGTTASTSGTLAKTGSGILVLSGENGHTGGTNLLQGTLNINSNAALGTGGTLTFTGGAILQAGASSVSVSTHPVVLTAGSGAATFDTNDHSMSFSDTITGSGSSLTKIGLGTMTIAGSGNTYTNATTVNEGELLVSGTITQTGGIIVNSGAALVVGDGGDLITSAAVTNNGTLTVNGGGALDAGSQTVSSSLGSTFTVIGLLTTTNSVTSNGTMTIDNGGVIEAGSAIVNSGSAFTVAGSLTSAGVVTAHSGSTLTVSSGGSLTSSGATTIGSGATLLGAGSITAPLTINGTIQPGDNAVGTMTIMTGPLTYESGAMTTILLNPTASSQISLASGTAALAGTVNVTVEPGTYALSQTYEILSAPSGYTSQFDPTVVAPSGYVATLTYTPDPVYLTLTQLLINSSDFNGNNAKVANALNAFQFNAAWQTVLTDLVELSSSQQTTALEAISPARGAFATYASMMNIYSVAGIVSSRMSDQRVQYRRAQESGGRAVASLERRFDEGRLLAANDKNKKSLPYGDTKRAAISSSKPMNNTIWVQGFGDWARQNAQNQTPTFNFTNWGVLAGYDHFGFKDGMIGIMVAYTHTGLTEHGNLGSNTINSGIVGPYGSGYFYNAYVELGTFFTLNSIHTKRNIAFTGFDAAATSMHNGYQITPHFGIGYDISFNWGYLEPYAVLDYVADWENKYTEVGAGVLDMTVASRFSSMLRSEIGLQAYEDWTMNWGMVILKEKAAYLNKAPFDVGTISTAFIGGSNFTVTSFTNNQNQFAGSLELLVKGNSGWFFDVRYDVEVGGGYIFDAEYKGGSGGGYVSNQIVGGVGAYF